VPDDTGRNREPSGGQWQFPHHAAQPPQPATQPGAQPSGEWPPTQPVGGYSGGWGQPPGAPPMSTAGPPPAVKPRRRVATILLAVATAVFLVAAGALGALYLNERSAHDRTQESSRSQIDGLQKELDSTKGKLTSAEQAKREQEGRSADLQKCKDAVNEFTDSVDANDEERGKQAYLAILTAC
jgi:Skp family chaperone for outer membrane proteins